MRLIDADALIAKFKDDLESLQEFAFQLATIGAINTVKHQPTVYAVPVRHGKWIHEVRYTIDSLHSYQQYRCSECGMTYITNTKYCPNCGARMDGDRDEPAKRL